MKMFEYFNLNNFNPDLLDTAKIKHFVNLMKQKYISYWQQALQHSQKLEFYKIFKDEYAPRPFLFCFFLRNLHFYCWIYIRQKHDFT